MDQLVERLCVENRQVSVGGPAPTVAEFHRRLTDIGYVFLLFPDTSGGTDLGVRVTKEATDVSAADFTGATGTVHFEGTLTLNYVPVRCVADIDLSTLSGTGHLVAR